jgi:hypothetical protein
MLRTILATAVLLVGMVPAANAQPQSCDAKCKERIRVGMDSRAYTRCMDTCTRETPASTKKPKNQY